MFFSLASLAVLLPAVLGQIVDVPLEIESIEALFTSAQLVPELLPTFTPTWGLHFSFDNSTDNSAGQSLTVAQVATPPTLHLYTTNTTTASPFYTLMMVDADVIGTDESVGQTRHWLVNDVSVSGTGETLAVNIANATAITDYAGPFPAAGSGPHRYCLFLYAQPSTFQAPSDLSTPGTPLANNWDFAGYVNSTGLGPLVAGTFYIVEQGTATASIPAIPTVVSSTLSLAKASAASAAGMGTQTGSAASPSGSSGSGSGSHSGAMSNAVSAVGVMAVAGLLGAMLL
ncbi:PEBP-like protein [Dacryopinax primogenitus]|uniref:PEBP-like protein n=1 Tax=Dacryopinax primogenitus (strain DJM 731) TaxID=1858805 RepID=M5G691_DACPD|nr:PEBP-like protein [Dacryopinax primogenitus]EJU05776.1 PEBP-like protein [Dacryopinax primogenitus]